jgi:aryl-alcohol dehydrogenase (NADP+)
VAEIDARRGVSNARVALAWLLHQPGVSAPIIGVSRMEQLEDLAGAVGFELDDAELASLAEPYRPHAVLGHS